MGVADVEEGWAFMIIKVLMENTTIDNNFLTEHGLSLYIETKAHKIFFDTGQSGGFLENAKKLGVAISEVDTVFISHGHYDHTGGLVAFFEMNQHAKVYVSAEGFSDLYSKKDEGNLVYIGMDKRLENHKQIIQVEDDGMIDEELEIFTKATKRYPKPSMNHTLMKKITVAIRMWSLVAFI
jgi:7,8-dihydropterin-6-yl-methyl-4-(beta-D-ribofuranosyl)aminobenzene 5'-phosphate synthase